MSKKGESTGSGLASRVMKLGDLAAYQSGAVVSREIMKGEAGTVSVFAFDEGEGLSEHTAPFDALVQIVDGSAEISISGNPYEVREGDSIIMPANRPHSLKALEPFKMVLTLIRA